MAPLSLPDMCYVLQLFVFISLIQEISAREIWEEDWFKWLMGFVGVIIFVVACRLVNVCKRRARVRAKTSNTAATANQKPDRPVSLPTMRRCSQSSSNTSHTGNESRSHVVSAPPNTLEPIAQPLALPPHPVTNAWSASDPNCPTDDALPPGYIINLSYDNNNRTVPPLPPIARPSAGLPPPSGPPPSYNSVVNEGNEHI